MSLQSTRSGRASPRRLHQIDAKWITLIGQDRRDDVNKKRVRALSREDTSRLIGRLLTVRVRRKQVSQLLLTGGQLHAADPDAESSTGSLSLLGDAAKEPCNSARYCPERMTRLRGTQHGVRLA